MRPSELRMLPMGESWIRAKLPWNLWPVEWERVEVNVVVEGAGMKNVVATGPADAAAGTNTVLVAMNTVPVGVEGTVGIGMMTNTVAEVEGDTVMIADAAAVRGAGAAVLDIAGAAAGE